ncbi:MAG: hypothetical protein ABID04_02465, partial [Patescibacteria group bacterium]
ADCFKQIAQYFPLVKETSARQLLFNPTHPASVDRAFQSGTKNHRKQMVNVIVMTPRELQKDVYLSVLAHELGHGLHRTVLEKGESSGILPAGSGDRVSHNVCEEFSQLLEHQFHQGKQLPYQKKFFGKEFPSFISARGTRFQVPISLVQLGIRKKFDRLWDSGFRGDLSEQAIRELEIEFDQKAKDWFSLGFKMVDNDLRSLALFFPYSPTDGLRYVKRYTIDIPKTKVSKDQPSSTLDLAFAKRFGREWVKNKEARTLFLWLLLESGRNQKTETYPELASKKKISECQTELKKIGIQR